MNNKMDDFKEFVRNNNHLISYIKNGSKSWQDFYEIYDGIAFGGLPSGLLSKGGVPDLSVIDELCALNAPKILLCHHPEHYPAHIRATSVELTLSGHAHGGQWHLLGRDIWSPGQGLFPKYASGMHRNAAGETLIVSRGMANTVKLAPRFGNPRELVVIRLTGEK